jgi:hypothetical protein
MNALLRHHLPRIIATAGLILTVILTGSMVAPAQQTAPSPGARRAPLSERQRPTLGDVNTDIGVDRRVIVMMAALNVAGYDYETGNRPLSPLRAQLREDLKAIDPELARRLREHFRKRSEGRAEAAAVAPYLSLALSLTEPPAFTLDVPPERLPEDVREIVDFALLLQEFHQSTGFSRLLPRYIAAYTAEAQKYGPAMAEAAGTVLAYLHTDPVLELPPTYIPRPSAPRKGQAESGPLVLPNRERRFVVIPDLLNARGTANLRVVRDVYFLLLGPTTEPNVDAMRRGFINFVIDPLTERAVKEVAAIRDPLKRLLESRGDKIDPEYRRRSAYYLITDSLVRATDARLAVLGLAARRKIDEAEAIYELSLAYERGSVLAFHFYDLMKAYEAVGINLRDYFTDLLAKIDFDREAKRLDEYAQRLARYKQSRLEAAASPAPASTISNADEQVVARILEADQLIKARRYAEARSMLEAVRRERPDNARALFGLADVTSKQASAISDSDKLAEELFAAAELYRLAAVNASPETEKWLAQRSYVAAGKILDFLGKEDDAAAAYDLALKLGAEADPAAYAEALKARQQREGKGKP